MMEPAERTEQGNGPCVNDLGARYYMGSIFEQDYRKAADLYGRAVGSGCASP